ncbi:MAG: hypothetical protein KDI43_10080 [Gammaproteobacteria bacterium]|nr:hypothetical protein [Gammaproteobacteria bacterium]MCP5407740.1 hypothetical protein [Chromatiaceae bacterium]MCP5441646.1 hypothetical protein [Chromatiaceae bacterium]
MKINVNDKLLSLTTGANASQGSRTSALSGEHGESDPNAVKKRVDDSLDLSNTGQLLQHSATAQTDKARSLPETMEQASALVARIRQQFEQSGSQALGAHSAIQGNRLDLLLRSVPV